MADDGRKASVEVDREGEKGEAWGVKMNARKAGTSRERRGRQ
jgi:hypothetical protein